MTSNGQPNIFGSIVALVTPMHADGSLDWAALERLVHWHIEQGTHALIAVGTTGESATLDVEEHAEVIKRTLAYAGGRVPVIAGTGANSTREAIELTMMAKRLGADAALLVTPYYNRPTQEGLFLHYKAVAEAVDLPQILYNVPSRTAVDLAHDTVLRLADVPNIMGIKDATGDLKRGLALIQALSGKIAVYSGDDATAWQLIGMGAKGNISVTANVAPVLMSHLCAAALAGAMEQVNQLHALLSPINDQMFVEANPIPVKWALHEMGLIDVGIRLPLTPLARPLREPLRAALAHAQLLPHTQG